MREDTPLRTMDPKARKMLELFSNRARARHADSNIFEEDKEMVVPRFSEPEIKLGRVLGRGGYCVVSEIKEFDLDELSPEQSMHPSEEENCGERSNMSKKVLRDGVARYALKVLASDVVNGEDTQRYVQGIIDVAVEAKYLSVLSHPNIIKMRGMGWTDPWAPGFFLILDRLYGTLDKKIIEWRGMSKRYSSILGKMTGKKKKMESLWENRLLALYDLATALTYMHELNIIYRDLKPDNIGFDVRGDIKIFDFGLAKEIFPDDTHENGLYKLTGNTGSLRYMAPEVYLNKPYGFTADVFSFGILFWQICALETPYSTYTVRMHGDLVIQKGYRPKADDSWNTNWVQLMKKCWDGDPLKRPLCETICEEFSEFLSQLQGEKMDTQSRAMSRSIASLTNVMSGLNSGSNH